MAIMQGADAVYWFWVSFVLTIAFAFAIWYMVLVGRDRKPERQERGEETIERYGTIEEDRAPTPKFLIFTYIGVVVWGIAYLFWIGTQGFGY